MRGELSRGEFIRKLNGRSSQEVCELGGEIFNEAVGKDLANNGDKVVMRRKIGGGKTVKEKLWKTSGLWWAPLRDASKLGEGMKVLVLAEHWLWPFELNKLSEINDNLEAVGKADVRLSESAQGSRGFGDIYVCCGTRGWRLHESVASTLITSVVLVSTRGSSENVMSVIGVYLPCLDLGIDCYREHLVELECVVSECEMLDSVVILGDCNAHLSVDGREYCYRKSWTGMTLQMSLRAA